MKNKAVQQTLTICLMLAFITAVVCCGRKEEFRENRLNRQVERTLSRMSTREKVAQLIVSQTDSYIFADGHALHTDTLVGIEGIGGLLVLQDSLPRYMKRMNELQAMSKIPLAISIDGEWGPSMRFGEFPFFPQQMQLGALTDDSLIYEMGLAVAEQCQMINIHINYAPVVDINTNPKNPVIHARSFGENRDKVTRFANAYMRGMQDGGIIACSKHFPGHGDTEVDSHKALPILPFSKERLDSLELYPFRDQINSGVKMVMMGHLHIPALDSAVSSISYPIVTGLLKEELGFDGLVVTDALTMKGVSENMEAPEIALAAYKAGVDILLKPGDIIGCIDRLEEAMLSGECDMAELDNRVRKTLRMKAEFGMLSRGYNPIIPVEGITERVMKPEHIALTQQLSEKSMTLVSNHHSLIPLNTSKKIAYVGYNAKRIPLRREYGDIDGLSGYTPEAGMVDSTTIMYHYIFRAVQDNAQGEIHYFELDKNSTKADIDALYRQLADYDQVVLACHDPRGRSRKNLLAEEHVDMLSKLVKKYHPVLVHFGSPYGLSELPWLQDAGAVLLGYQDSWSNQRAAGKVLIGAIPAEGELPVTL